MNNYLKAATVADALSLGSHWIYNQGKLARVYKNGVTEFSDPISSYHPNRKAGQLTHYGDQMVLLAESLKKQNGFNLAAWRKDWLSEMAHYDGYVDGATKETMANQGEQPSSSNDLAGASRLAPILDLNLSAEEKVAASRAQTLLTHGDIGVADAAEFFVRATLAVDAGMTIEEAFKTASNQGAYIELPVADHLSSVLSKGDDLLAVSTEIGLTCHLPEAFPLSLYLSLRAGATFQSAMSENALAGGDTSARAMLIALIFAARDGDVGSLLASGLIGKTASKTATSTPALTVGSNNVVIEGPAGRLAGILEVPEGEIKGYALFAHCFTCGKDFLPGPRISKGLSERGIATLRIDFSGLGKSGGDFSGSSFLTNVDDLKAAADWLRINYKAPELLIGHSLGGAAVLAASGQIDEVKAVATIGAPADPQHVTHLFDAHLPQIKQEGQAKVKLAGRSFIIGKRFLDDLHDHHQEETLSKLQGVETLIMHSPTDETVPLENAGKIYSALHHPKSFISLSGADHLLTNEDDSNYVVDLIQVWASRILRG